MEDQSHKYIQLEESFGAHNYHPLPVVIAKAQGVWMWDVNEKKYLDCLACYSAVNQGHRHPSIINELKNQLDTLTLTSRAFHNNQLGRFLQRLCQFTRMDVALPMNTGAEAVETGIKIARRWGYRIKKVPSNQAEIIVCANNFHGRTTTIVGFSSDPDCYGDFGPATPGFKIIPYNNPTALEEAITPNTVGFLIEPIQGEAGVIVPSPNYLRKTKDICEAHNVLFMADEIQTGFGRTGMNFACDYENVQPDILMVGKALGGGVYPISAALSQKAIMDVITPGSHGSTFGGNPLACAVGTVAMDVIEKEKLTENAAKLGDYFKKCLKNIKTDRIKEIRGKGLLLGVEFKKEYGPCKPVVLELMKNGILAKDTHEQTIRFAPPLIIDKETIDWAVNTIEHSIKSAQMKK